MHPAPLPTTLARALRRSFERDLCPQTGFLPARVPATTLPAPFDVFIRACTVLAARYHRPDGSVRGWLEELFGTHDAELDRQWHRLQDHQRHGLMTAVSVLCHAYRWDRAQPDAAAYRLTSLRLPEGLRVPWQRLADDLGQPRVGNLFNIVLCNWAMPGRQGGAPYHASEVDAERVQPAFLWLKGPEADELRAFLRTGIETEARGAAVVATAVEVVEACAAGCVHGALALLQRLQTELEAMQRPFKTYIRKGAIRPRSFMDVIQPTTIWLLDEGDGPLEGASGPQFGCIQVADALLGVGRDSAMARAILHSRRYMPAPHRRFLAAMDRCGALLPELVARSGDAALEQAHRQCLDLMARWRVMHQQRGAYYLSQAGSDADDNYTSTGLLVGLDDDRVQVFRSAMQERIDETRGATGCPQRVARPAAAARCPFSAGALTAG